MEAEPQAHEHLFVYKKSLTFMASAQSLIASWDSRHAVGDELDRASESVVLNLAEAVSLYSAEARLATLDYALGSGCECAACLDIALIKELVTCDQCLEEKSNLSEIVRMLHGLRQDWNQELKEEASAVEASEKNTAVPKFFAHEGLDAYRTSLDFMRWFTPLAPRVDLPPATWHQLDKAGTALVLNIAEGNGRLSKTEHARFLRLAMQAGVRAGAYLDLLTTRQIMTSEVANGGRFFLRTAICLVRGLTRYLEDYE